MPIYEYRCKGCGHTLEAIQKLGARPLAKCPECSGKLEKLISRAAFQLKGGGWYAEGYGQSSPSSSSPSSSSPSSESSESSGSTDSAKPDKKKAAAGGCGSGSCGCH